MDPLRMGKFHFWLFVIGVFAAALILAVFFAAAGAKCLAAGC